MSKLLFYYESFKALSQLVIFDKEIFSFYATFTFDHEVFHNDFDYL